MTSSSSCARAADILDLDHYMRSSVRPSHHHTRDRLVVDAGGADRVPLACSSAESVRSPRAREHAKRYSHDSGLSDDSYVKRRHRPHRRISDSKRESTRTGSKSSVLEFRAACEQALRDQQEQIARVAELCQKLVQPQLATNYNLQKNVSPFVSNMNQNASNVSPFVSNMNQNASNVSPFVSNMNQNASNVSPFISNVNQNASNVSPFLSNVNQNASNGSPFVSNVNQNASNVPNIPPQPTSNFDKNRPIFTTNQHQTSTNFDQNTNLIQERAQPYIGQNYMNQQQMEVNKNVTKQNFSQNVNQRIATDSSEASSTSRSTRELRRKEKVRSDSCKTYTIIMNKLDELNHLFATRRAQPAVQRPIVARRPPDSRPSSECVSVCNKLVATDDFRGKRNQNNPVIQVVHTRVKRGQSEGHSIFHSSGRARHVGPRLREMEMALDASCGSESILHSQGEEVDAEGWNETAQDFDLNNPLKLYEQAKRLQTLHANTRRKSPSNHSPDRLDDELGDQLAGRSSLCSMCRSYWRALRRCLTQQLFGDCS